MSRNLVRFILFASLLAGAAAWVIARSHSHPRIPTAPNPETVISTPAPVAETVMTTVEGKPSPEPIHTASSPAIPPLPSYDRSVLTNAGSPLESDDLDKNRQWARAFPDAAASWLRNAEDGEQKIAIAETVCPQIAETNPAAAVTLVESTLGTSTNTAAQYLLQNMAAQWAEKDLPAASAWAFAQAPDEQRDLLIERIAFVESKTDPYHAAQLAVKEISPGQTQGEAVMAVLHQWAQHDAPSAMTWVESFPQGELRDRALAEVHNVSTVSQAP